jgi:hypothetical protein
MIVGHASEDSCTFLLGGFLSEVKFPQYYYNKILKNHDLKTMREL